MQLSDMVTEVRKTLGEVEPNGYGSQQTGQGTWDNSQIIGYINEAIGLLSHLTRAEGSQTIALTTSTNQYNLPTDCLEDGIRKLVYNTLDASGNPTNGGPVPVEPLDMDEFEKIFYNQKNQSPGFLFRYFYTIWNGQILLAPYPGQSTDTMTIYYYKTLPSLANASDVPAIPARFHLALVYFALARCQEAVEETNLYQLAMQQYEIVAAQLRAELSRKSRDRNRVRSR